MKERNQKETGRKEAGRKEACRKKVSREEAGSKKKINLKKTAEELLELVFPARCPVCDKPVAYFDRESGRCPECMGRLPFIRGKRCYLCGRELAGEKEELCEDCDGKEGRRFYTRGFALCSYEDVMRESVYRFKYGGRREYAQVYGRLMAERFKDAMRRAKIEGIIPVPLHPAREKQRGYNQAALLARALGAYTGVPVYEDYVVRVRHTPPMKTLGAGERQNNLKRAFKIRRNDVKLKITIVIDDIYTTGSTIDAVAKTLINAGVSRVYFMTLAIGGDH